MHLSVLTRCFAVIAVLLAVGCTSTPPIQEGMLDCEGLSRISSAGLGGLCVREEMTTGYDGAMLDEIEYGIRPVGTSSDSTYVGREASSRYPVGPQQKKALESLAETAFDDALTDLNLERHSEPGPGVLSVRGQILDVALEAPEDPESGAKYLMDTIGRATLVVDLYDSQTEELLLRAFDHRETSPLTAESDSADSHMAAIASLWQEVLTEAVGHLPN